MYGTFNLCLVCIECLKIDDSYSFDECQNKEPVKSAREVIAMGALL